MAESVPLLLAALVAVATVAVSAGLYNVLGSEVDVTERLGEYIPTTKHEDSGRGGRARLGRSTHGFTVAIARDLARANLKLTVSEFVFLHFVTALVCFTAAYLFVGKPAPALPFAVLGLFLPRVYVGQRRQQRRNAFNGQLADTMMLVANSLRSGFSLLQSFDVVSREAPVPTSEEFSRVVREVSLGLSPEEALGNLVHRLESEDLDLMVTAINVQHEVGGNLARILDSISGTIRERVRVKGEIKTLTSSQRLTGYVISLLPVVIGGILYLVNPSYVLQLFSFQRVICMPVIMLPVIAGVLMFLGFMVIRKIVAIEV